MAELTEGWTTFSEGFANTFGAILTWMGVNSGYLVSAIVAIIVIWVLYRYLPNSRGNSQRSSYRGYSRPRYRRQTRYTRRYYRY